MTTRLQRLMPAVAVTVLVGLGACGADDDTPTTDAASGSSAAASAVAIRGFAFDPNSVTVAAGTEVTFSNEDQTDHTVTADDGSFDSKPIAGDGTFEHTFDQAGTFAYHCAIHSSMTGTVTVS